jgi:hypothetical protein
LVTDRLRALETHLRLSRSPESERTEGRKRNSPTKQKRLENSSTGAESRRKQFDDPAADDDDDGAEDRLSVRESNAERRIENVFVDQTSFLEFEFEKFSIFDEFRRFCCCSPFKCRSIFMISCIGA